MDNVIAIDGPAASGKSTVSSRLAKHLDIPYINTGNMYRAVSWFLIKHIGAAAVDGLDDSKVKPFLIKMNLQYKKDQDDIYRLYVDDINVESVIRTPEISACTSKISAIPAVRKWLLDKQRAFLDNDGKTIVMEGRDIGTVVFPEARYKFFITASPEVRAQRRLEQKGENYDGATLASVAKDIAQRDENDRNRKIAPLKQADDAVFIDTSNLTLEQVVNTILETIKER